MIKFKFKYISYTAMVLSATAIGSCNKLDEDNPHGSTADNIWASPAGFISAVNSAYFEQGNWYGKEDGVYMSEAGTDIWYASAKGTNAKELCKYESFTDAQGTVKNAWLHIWKGINQCNAGINRIDQAGFTDPVEKNKRLAELRFLRAFYYWHVVEQWGGVMLRTTETNGALLSATRSTPEEFYDVMIGDLEFAKDNLPNDWGAEWSRATKKSALGLLARVYLTRAYYSGDANSWFTKARNAAQEVIDRKVEFKVDLWSTYEDLFKQANNKKNKEALYTITYSASNWQANYDGNAQRMHMFYLSQYTARPGLKRSIDYGREDDRKLMPTMAFLDLFDREKDARYDAQFQEVWICNSQFPWTAADVARYGKTPSMVGTIMKVGDTALVVTKESIPATTRDKSLVPYILWDRDSIYNTSTIDTIIFANSTNYVTLKKFSDATRPKADQRQGYNDLYPIRFGEMYLIAAEAEFKLGNSAAAANYINDLRKRATKPGHENDFKVTSSDITVDFILDERAREMCGEWMRWFDLKRMLTPAQFVARIKKYNPDITTVDEHHVLRPVPLLEMSALLNRDDFKQNPGY